MLIAQLPTSYPSQAKLLILLGCDVMGKHSAPLIRTGVSVVHDLHREGCIVIVTAHNALWHPTVRPLQKGLYGPAFALQGAFSHLVPHSPQEIAVLFIVEHEH